MHGRATIPVKDETGIPIGARPERAVRVGLGIVRDIDDLGMGKPEGERHADRGRKQTYCFHNAG